MPIENIVVITEREQYFRDIGWTVFDDLYSVLFKLDFESELQFDLETTGLNSFLVEKVNSVQIGVPGCQYVFDIPSLEGGMSSLKRLLEEKILIGHNLLFDLPYVYKEGIEATKIFDTQAVEECLLRGLKVRHGLDRWKNLSDTLRRHINVTLDKGLQSTISSGLDSVEKIRYAGLDVLHLADLKEAQLKTAARRKLERNLVLANRFVPVMAYIEYCGFRMNPKRLNDWIREVEPLEFSAEKKLMTYADINWRSTSQVGELLKTYGIEEYTKKGNLKTDEDVLKKYDIPIAKDLLEFRGLSKQVDTYGRKFFYYIQDDGRIHTKYRQNTETGRTSSGDTQGNKKYKPWDKNYKVDKPYPNLQNIPKESDYRGLFCAEKGNKLIVCDYGSQESVILAEKSQDPVMMDFFLNGDGDMHSLVTRYVNPELADLTSEEIQENHKDKRGKNKEATYALAYGGNGKTVADNIGVSREEGDDFCDKYFGLFKGLKPYYKRCFERAASLGYMAIDSLTGGKRYFDRWKEFQEKFSDKKYWDRYWRERDMDSEWFHKEKEKMKWYNVMRSELMKLAVNTEIQGTAAVMTKLAAIYFFEWIVRSHLFGKVLLVNFVHDELVAECKEKETTKVAVKLQECMELAGSKILHTLKIKAVPVISDIWKK